MFESHRNRSYRYRIPALGALDEEHVVVSIYGLGAEAEIMIQHAGAVLIEYDPDSTYPDVIDRSNLKTSRVGSQNFLLKILHIVKAVISHIGGFAQSKGEFAMSE
jgi:hypothetical protein